MLGVRDTIRPEAADVLAQLRQAGIEQIVMLTGDRSAAAAHVARSVGDRDVRRRTAAGREGELAGGLV